MKLIWSYATVVSGIYVVVIPYAIEAESVESAKQHILELADQADRAGQESFDYKGPKLVSLYVVHDWTDTEYTPGSRVLREPDVLSLEDWFERKLDEPE